MKKIILSILLSTLLLSSFSLLHENKSSVEVNADTDYYASIKSTMKGDTLKVALYNVIKGHTKFSYGSLEIQMKVTDRDYTLSPEGTDDDNPYMRLLYADYNGSTSTAKRWNTSQGNYGVTSGYVWNKEHIWAKSNGFDQKGLEAYCDLHHLRASDWKCNNTRSNYPFGNVANHTSSNASYDWTQNRKTDNYLEKGVFEPRDSDKGDVARALFYMATRYYDGDGSGGTSLSLTTGTDSSDGKWGYLDTLIAWHEQDPVDEFEAHRNDLVYSFQQNRNPYIDHPEYVRAVFKNEAIVEPDTLTNLTYTGTPSKLEYKEGELFNPLGLTVTATFKKNDNSTYNQVVTNDVSWTPNPLVKDTTSVTGTYSYNGVNKTIIINGISVISLNSISISGYPDKIVYEEGDIFDPTGLMVKAKYSNNQEVDVTSSASWDAVPLTKGQTSVNVTYGGKQATYLGIHVKEKQLSAARIQFNTVSTDSTNATTASAIQNNLVSGSDIATISSAENIYEGKYGVKFSSGKKSGSMTITLKTATLVNKLNFYTQKYSNDSTTVTVTTSASVGGTFSPTSSLEVNSIDINATISTITISSPSGQRFYLNYVEVVSGSGGGQSSDKLVQWGIDYLFIGDSSFDGNGTGLCKTGNYYRAAKKALLTLESTTSGLINTLKTNSTYSKEYNRYIAWSKANNDSMPFDNDYSFLNNKANYINDDTSNLFIIVVVTSIVVTISLSTLLLIKRRKHK